MSDENRYQPVLDMNRLALMFGIITEADHDLYARKIAFMVARENAAKNPAPKRVLL